MAIAQDETPVEARIARLESDVGHIRSDIGDMKQDIRDLGGRFDDMRDRMEAMDRRLSERIYGVERSLWSAKVWALLLFIAQAAAVYGTLARTMGWI
jgi:hypothetical protein